MDNWVQQLREMVKQYPGLIQPGVPASEDQIQAIETRLGLAFPDEYRQYLRSFGSLDIGGDELIGISRADDLNVVHEYPRLVSNYKMPTDLIPIQSGYGHSFTCLRGTDGCVVWWEPNAAALTAISDSLSDFILQRCAETIEDEGDLD